MDAYEFSAVPATLTVGELNGETYKKSVNGADTFVKVADDSVATADQTAVVEYKPHFYEWATA